MEVRANSFLETEKIGVLMRRYAVPCVISLLVAALYNIVDQVFITNADYLGSCGNAANTTVFPLTVVALAIATLIGDGCCAFVSISLGAGRKDDAHKSIGSAALLCVIASLGLTAVYLALREPILTLFGVGLPILLPLAFGLSGVLYSFPVADVLTFAICVAVIAYTYRKLEGGSPAAANA